MHIVKIQNIRGHRAITIPRKLSNKIRGQYMMVVLDGRRLIYEELPVEEAGSEAGLTDSVRDDKIETQNTLIEEAQK